MATAVTGGRVRPEILADTEWLKRRLDDPNLGIIDCRDEPANHKERHIPGTVYMNYKRMRCDDGVHLLTPGETARTFGEIGIGGENEVVVYDDVGSYSAWIWRTLHHYGHRHVRILNGGWKKWISDGYAVTRELLRPEFAAFLSVLSDDDIVSAEEAERRLDDPGTSIFDSRSGVEYFGVLEKLGFKGHARRPGHVPSVR